VIRRRRGDHNRLGFAVHLCYVRFPGQLLSICEPPYAPILAMAAAQLKVPTGIWAFYAERDQTRREHLLELQEQFGLLGLHGGPFTFADRLAGRRLLHH
jgi:TnpA family transposase